MESPDIRLEISEQRSYKVIKANEIVRKARYELNITELKILAYMISKVKPADQPDQDYTFSIQDFCRVCGIDHTSGKNYKRLKETLKSMGDKSFWLTQENGSEVLIRWLGKVKLDKRSGNVSIQFDKDLQRYIVGLYENYTQYELFATLPMTSSYSFRLYELLKSYQYKRDKYEQIFDVDDLKERLAAPYPAFKDFRVRALDVATKEINLYTDLEISWEPIKGHRGKVEEIRFEVVQRDFFGRMETLANAKKKLDGQLSLDYIPY